MVQRLVPIGPVLTALKQGQPIEDWLSEHFSELPIDAARSIVVAACEVKVDRFSDVYPHLKRHPLCWCICLGRHDIPSRLLEQLDPNCPSYQIAIKVVETEPLCRDCIRLQGEVFDLLFAEVKRRLRLDENTAVGYGPYLIFGSGRVEVNHEGTFDKNGDEPMSVTPNEKGWFQRVDFERTGMNKNVRRSGLRSLDDFNVFTDLNKWPGGSLHLGDLITAPRDRDVLLLGVRSNIDHGELVGRGVHQSNPCDCFRYWPVRNTLRDREFFAEHADRVCHAESANLPFPSSAYMVNGKIVREGTSKRGFKLVPVDRGFRSRVIWLPFSCFKSRTNKAPSVVRATTSDCDILLEEKWQDDVSLYGAILAVVNEGGQLTLSNGRRFTVDGELVNERN